MSIPGHRRFLNELLVSVEKGTYVKLARLTLGDWLTQWFNSYVIMHTTPRTQESYGSIIRQHIIPALGAVPLDSLRPHHLERYYGKALDSGRTDGWGGLSARSVLYHHRILSEALGHAVKMGIVARNAAAVVDPPRPARVKMATLSTDEINRFLDAARGTSHYVFFAALLCTGLRRGELLALRWRNLDLEQAVPVFTVKGCRIGKPQRHWIIRRLKGLDRTEPDTK